MLTPTRCGRLIAGVFCGALFVLGLAFSFGAAAETRLALVIGNSTYRSYPELANAQEDAGLISASLKQARFEVLTVVNADMARLRDSVDTFAAKVKGAQPGAVAFIYYAGHGGADDEQRNYLFPTDMDVQATSAAPEGAYPLDALLATLNSRHLRLAFLVLDTDQSDPFRNRREDAGSADIDTPPATPAVRRPGKVVLAFSGSPGPVSSEPSGKNGPYAEALAQEMLRPGSSAGNVFRRVNERVLAASDGLQKPSVSDMPDRVFYFNGKPEVKPVVSAGIGAKEEELWQAAEAATGKEEKFSTYNRLTVRYPNGRYAELARQRMRGMLTLDAPAVALRPGNSELIAQADGSPKQAYQRFSGYDLPGGDLYAPGMRASSAAECERLCQEDSSSTCRAYTFNTQHNRCFLKSAAGPKVAYGAAVSGVLGTELQTGLSVARPMKTQRDTDYPSGDYRDIKGMTEEGCSTTCGTDSRCVAFSYVPNERWCWLKSKIGRSSSAVGVVSGLKR
jgi:hypothetical protein